jgi:translocator protein
MNSNRSHSRRAQIVLNLAALVVMLVVNTLATTLPLGGRTTAEISDTFDLRFVPAGYVFSIWGLIYLALIGFAIFQALPGQQANRLVRATGWWFVVSSVANSLWIVFWHYGYYPLTLAMMLTLLASLIVVYRRLAAGPGKPSPAARWLVQFPFSLYLGWITVATVANASAVLVDLGWDGRPLTPVTWTVILIAVAAGLALVMLRRHRDLTYAGVIVWALVGILIQQQAYAPIVAAAAIGLGAIILGALAIQWRKPALALEIAK